MERIGSGTRGGTGNVKRDGDGKFNDVLPFSLLRRRKSAFPVSHQNSVHHMAALVPLPIAVFSRSIHGWWSSQRSVVMCNFHATGENCGSTCRFGEWAL